MQTVYHFARRDDTSGLFSQIARRRDKERYAMRMVTLEAMDAELKARVAAQDVPCADFRARSKSMKDYLRVVPLLARDLRRRRVPILHTHFYYPTIVGGMAGVLARVPVRVMTRHHSDYHTRLTPGRNRHVLMDQLTTKLHHRVFAISQHTADHLLHAEGAPPHKVVVVPNGIDFDDVKPSPPEKIAALRRELGGDERDLILLVARFSPEKGLEYLYEGLAELRRRANRPFTILHAGTGDRFEEYETLLASTGQADLVQFLGFRRDVPDLMAASDFMVLPSTMEAFGLVLAEALYLNLPVVATRVGGVPEIVSHERDGLLVPHADTPALVDAMARMLNEPEMRRAMAGQGRQKIVEQFAFQKMLSGYEKVYEELSRERGLL